MIAQDVGERGWVPRFSRGDRRSNNFAEHFKGKLAEAGFQIHAEDHGGVNVEATPIRFRYGPRSLTYDFSFYRPDDGMRLAAEVKSGTKTFAEVATWDLNDKGMPVNKKQVDDCKGLQDYFVYCVVDRTGLNDPLEPVVKVAVMGWCRWDTIIRQPVRSRMESPCYIVPLADLKPMCDFYDIIKTGCKANTKTANSNVILEV